MVGLLSRPPGAAQFFEIMIVIGAGYSVRKLLAATLPVRRSS
jgi:hypothetical protein